ncbi:MAG TPA: low affinity iron permease family protein [Candidatus Binatia bacterium]|nr:low affinity iron permease family protein [Candidatus Binatia bacterium]
MGALFHRFAKWTANATGQPSTFALCVVIVLVWALTGPLFGFSDSWQLIINTATTIITFLMVFLIQNTQNRDTREVHLKLDELIRSNKHARNLLLDLEELDDKQLERLRAVYERLGQKARLKEEP